MLIVQTRLCYVCLSANLGLLFIELHTDRTRTAYGNCTCEGPSALTACLWSWMMACGWSDAVLMTWGVLGFHAHSGITQMAAPTGGAVSASTDPYGITGGGTPHLPTCSLRVWRVNEWVVGLLLPENIRGGKWSKRWLNKRLLGKVTAYGFGPGYWLIYNVTIHSMLPRPQRDMSLSRIIL